MYFYHFGGILVLYYNFVTSANHWNEKYLRFEPGNAD
jgi:hypothetical protein